MPEGGGGSGSGINSVIEAEFRARELGGPAQPDYADEHAESVARRAAWIVSGIAVIAAGTWFVAGLEAAAIVGAALGLGVLAIWWIAARLSGRKHEGSPASSRTDT